MKFHVDDHILKLVKGPVFWFADSGDPAKLISEQVMAKLRGVYCLWWKDPTCLKAAPPIELAAGKRGKLSVDLKLHENEFGDSAALYVGKGAVRSRLMSHVKPRPGRNPYWWITQMVKEVEGHSVIRLHLGFSFVEEPDNLEQAYTENLAIGILRPCFNFRFTA